MKKLLLCAAFCLPVSIYGIENDDELNKLKMLPSLTLLEELPKKPDKPKTGMSESYLTFIREPIYSINLPYFDDEVTKADCILKESLRIHYAFLQNIYKTHQKDESKNN